MNDRIASSLPIKGNLVIVTRPTKRTQVFKTPTRTRQPRNEKQAIADGPEPRDIILNRPIDRPGVEASGRQKTFIPSLM